MVSKVVLIAVVIAVLCTLLLPFVTRLACFEVIRNNIEKEISCDAYFYTEIKGFQTFEDRIGTMRARTD